MHDELVEPRHTRTVPADMRMHGQHIQTVFVVRDVELGLPNLLDESRRRKRAARCAIVRRVVYDALDWKLNHAARLSVQLDLVSIVARHQAAVVQKTGILDLTHRESTEMPRWRPLADRFPA